MELLITPKPFVDESLESYLLRLAEENGFESYQVFSAVVHEWLQEHDHRAAGAFPLSLGLLNVFHANRSSGLRVRVIQLFEQLAHSGELPLLKLALMHSSATFGKRRAAVFRDGIDIPRSFIRLCGIPVCPACLNEQPYIRQRWHFKPYSVCHKHGITLISNCPGCGELLDYQNNELITHCHCGYDLRFAGQEKATTETLQLSRLVSGETVEGTDPLSTAINLSVRFGALQWFEAFSGCELTEQEAISKAIEFFNGWPQGLVDGLELRREHAELRLVKSYNRTLFAEVFGELLLDARKLPMRDLGRNFVLKAIIDYLSELVRNNAQSKQANVGDVLLSLVEAAAVLSSNAEAVYRLYQEGFLVLAVRPKGRSKLETYTPAFRLRDVMELRLARMQSQNDSGDRYLPAW
ncbi:TniQ family protein [Ferrimonas lipolytica]|uniref:TniQ family protein n=1 Tax=Ferrimonas lipolytica TaxID=2724191 RepID=A0A6H1UB00_9GAMM|nr:TniQ family protein [Ferrimonas lipolytica]QIZ75760.1 TniQ family protein [Ferrimonas lipolytica]